MTAGVKAQAEALLANWGERDELALISGDLYRLQHADPATITDPHDLYETAPGTTILCGPHADLGGAAPYLPLVLAAPTLARQVVELAEEVQRLREALEECGHLAAVGLDGTRNQAPEYQLSGIEERARAALATQEARHD